MKIKLEEVKCNICGGDDFKELFETSYEHYMRLREDLDFSEDIIAKIKKLREYPFKLVMCRDCGLVFVNPRLKAEVLDKIYEKSYLKSYLDFESKAHKNRETTFKVEIEDLKEFVDFKKDLKVLDYGSGAGFFLNALPNNFKKFGFEINKFAAEFGNEKFNLDIRTELNFDDDFFDLIKIRGTIEHLPDPSGTVMKLKSLLRTGGGIIAIHTPNINSLCFAIYGKNFRFNDPIHHIYYFSDITLTKLLERIGFRILAYKYHYFDTPYFSKENFEKILNDLNNSERGVSPPFYGNVVDTYAEKY